MDGQARRREKLDCPAVPPLEQKLANLTRERPAIGPAPRSAVLDKLAAFLPQLAHENARLQQQMQERPAEDFDIERIENEKDSPYIEMDLACGILELRDEAALRAAERAMDGQGDPFLAAASSSSDDSSSDDDDEDEDDDDAEGSSGADVDGEGCGGDDADLAQGPDPMEEEETGVGGDGAGGSAQAAGGGRRGRAGRGRAVQVAAGRVPGALPDGRRKVAAKRSKMIEELS